MNRQEAEAIQKAFKTLADSTAALVQDVMDSFAARCRDEARNGHRADTMEALLAVARSAEEVASALREELNRQRTNQAQAVAGMKLIFEETETGG